MDFFIFNLPIRIIMEVHLSMTLFSLYGSINANFSTVGFAVSTCFTLATLLLFILIPLKLTILIVGYHSELQHYRFRKKFLAIYLGVNTKKGLISSMNGVFFFLRRSVYIGIIILLDGSGQI
jgi:hypothetical protein